MKIREFIKLLQMQPEHFQERQLVFTIDNEIIDYIRAQDEDDLEGFSTGIFDISQGPRYEVTITLLK